MLPLGPDPALCDALIAAGLRRVVVALEDPDPRVAGEGLRRLRAAGLEPENGGCAAEASEVNAAFSAGCGSQAARHPEARDLAHGRIATGSGESQWITGPPARERAHALRATHDAIMAAPGRSLPTILN